MADICTGCGTCCKLFLINLNEEEYRSKKYKTQFDSLDFSNDFVEYKNTILQKKYFEGR